MAPWLAGAPLTSLFKPDGDIRPIAVGETLRRLVGSCLMRHISKDAEKHLAPLQLGVATKSGCEAVYHSLRSRVKMHGSSTKYALLKVDFANAFNLVSRSAFFQAVRAHFPDLARWVEYCYATAPAYLWYDTPLLMSVLGVQQGVR